MMRIYIYERQYQVIRIKKKMTDRRYKRGGFGLVCWFVFYGSLMKVSSWVSLVKWYNSSGGSSDDDNRKEKRRREEESSSSSSSSKCQIK